MTQQTKILIVEDQKYPLMPLEQAVRVVAPKYFENYSGHDVARSYSSARDMILKENYELILLDNRMPYSDQGKLEDTDFNKFSASLENIGYTLIPVIKTKNSKTIVVGTSSLDAHELKNLPKPDFKMKKEWDNAEKDLEAILTQVKGVAK